MFGSEKERFFDLQDENKKLISERDAWKKTAEKMTVKYYQALDLMKEMAEALEKIANEKNLDIKAIIKSYASQDYNYEHTPNEFIQSEIAFDCLKKFREWK